MARGFSWKAWRDWGKACVLAVCAGVMITTLTSAPAAQATEYPDQPIELIVNFPPGGLADLSARMLADLASPNLPHPIVVVNRPGGTGTIGASEVLAATPDGYKLGLSPIAPMLVMPQRMDLPYKTPDDFQAIASLVDTLFVFAVHESTPYESFQDFVAAAQEQPGVITVGVGGLNSIPHMLLEALSAEAGIEVTAVPFGGDPRLVPALLGGHVDAAVILPLSVRDHAETGRVRVLTTFADGRHPLFPDTPSGQELGWESGLGAYTFVYGPNGLPNEVVNVLQEAFEDAIGSEDFSRFAADRGLVVRHTDGEALDSRLQADFDAYGTLIENLGL